MKPRQHLLALAGLLLLATVALLVLTRRATAPLQASTTPEETPARPRTLVQPDAQRPSRQEAAEPVAERAERSEPTSCLELVTRAAIDTSFWPPLNNVATFEDIDLLPLKLLVERNHLSFEDLVRAAREAPVGDMRRATALAATAFCEGVTAEQQQELTLLVRESLGAMQTMDREAASAGFAALFSLRVHDAENELLEAAQDLTAAYSTQRPPSWAVICALQLAADGAATPLVDQDFAIAAQDLEPSMGTSAIWGVLARSRPEEVIRAAEANGHAREGLERVRDPVLLPALLGIATRPLDSVYAKYMAESASRALLTSDSSAAWAAFETLVDQDHPAAIRALELARSPSDVGDLIRLKMLAEPLALSPATVPALESCLQRSLLALSRCQASRATAARACSGLRANWGFVQMEPAMLGRAIEVLVIHGDEDDRQFAEQWLWRADEDSQARIEPILSSRS